MWPSPNVATGWKKEAGLNAFQGHFQSLHIILDDRGVHMLTYIETLPQVYESLRHG